MFMYKENIAKANTNFEILPKTHFLGQIKIVGESMGKCIQLNGD